MSKFNPFRPGSLVTPGMFCGRFEEIRQTEQGLFQTKYGNPYHFVIEGERGIGKSSLFRLLDWVASGEVATMNNSALNFIVLNVELRDSFTYDDILRRILVELRRQVASRDKIKETCRKAWSVLSRFEVMGIGYKSVEREEQADFLDELTVALTDLLGPGNDNIDGVLLLIDEADKPSTDAKLGELCKILTERLSREGRERLSIGLAGLPGLVNRLRDSHASSPRIFSVLSLNPLEQHERIQVIEKGLGDAERVNKFKTEITDEAKELIAALAEGYPHFLQEFAHSAFDRDSDNLIDKADVLEGAFSENGALDQLGRKYFTELYIAQIGSEDYRRVLYAMAESLDEFVSRPEIIARSGVKERIVDNALRALKDRSIIVANDRARGEYRLPTKSFAVWIRARETARSAEIGMSTPQPALD
jgi:hypothetical protein